MSLSKLKVEVTLDSFKSLLIHGLLLLVLLPLPIRYDNVLLFGLSLALFSLAVLIAFRGGAIIYSKIGVVLLLFIPFCLLSNMFALNVSLTWYPFFTKVTFVSFVILISSQIKHDDFYSLSVYSTIGCFVFILLALCTFVYGEAPHPCRYCFSQIGNYICGFGLLLLPFLCFNDCLSGKLNVILSLLFSLTVLALALNSGARGVFVSFFMIFFIFLFLERKTKVLLSLLFIASIAFLTFFLLLNTDFVLEFGKRFELSRYYNQLIAIDIFSSYPLLGCGLGNWSLAFNSLSLDRYNDFYLYYNHLMNIDNHNQLTDLFAEIGIGAILLYGPVLYLIGRAIKEYESLATIEKAALYTSCCFMILSLFYRSVNSDVYFFSRSQYLFALSLGLLLKRNGLNKGRDFYNALIILALLLSSIWFVYWNLKDSNFKDNLNSVKSIESKLIKTDGIYNSIFYTHNSKKQSLKSFNAEMCLTLGDSIRSIAYFRKALDDSPNDPNVLLKLAILTLRQGDYVTARDYAERLIKIEEDYVEPLLILAEIAVNCSDFNNAIRYLDMIENSVFYKPYIPYVTFWNTEIIRKVNGFYLDLETSELRREITDLLQKNELSRQRSYPDFIKLQKLTQGYLKNFKID